MSKNLLPRLRRNENKKKALKYLGGKRCARGGATHLHEKCYDFHHTTLDKHKDISMMLGKEWNRKLEEELDKCVILCSNCHRIVHHEINNRVFSKKLVFDEPIHGVGCTPL